MLLIHTLHPFRHQINSHWFHTEEDWQFPTVVFSHKSSNSHFAVVIASVAGQVSGFTIKPLCGTWRLLEVGAALTPFSPPGAALGVDQFYLKKCFITLELIHSCSVDLLVILLVYSKAPFLESLTGGSSLDSSCQDKLLGNLSLLCGECRGELFLWYWPLAGSSLQPSCFTGPFDYLSGLFLFILIKAVAIISFMSLTSCTLKSFLLLSCGFMFIFC